jgi:hypothetical protein
MTDLKDRARRRGTASIYAGTEPRRGELTAHEPKPKIKRQRFTLPKRTMKRRRKDRANRHADVMNYQMLLDEPWTIYRGTGKGGLEKRRP